MIAIAALTSVFVFLFLIWKVRYRYPPTHAPQVLCYHKLSDKFLLEGTWTTRQRFLRQIDGLKDSGYQFVTEGEFSQALAEPMAGDARKVLLTFDDGYEELYDVCLEELCPRGIPVLVFLVTDFAGQDNRWDLSLGRRPARHLSWDQVRQLSERGIRFGSHSASHNDLAALDDAELDREVAGSRKVIQQETGIEARSFSYPFGRYDARVRGAVREAGYTNAFSLYPPHSNESVDPFALRRNGVYVIDTPFTIRCKLTPNPLFWFEEMKGRAINRIAALTPAFKRFSAGPGK